MSSVAASRPSQPAPAAPKTRLRVGYLFRGNPRDRWSWSGTHSYMFEALLAAGLDVRHIGGQGERGSRLVRWASRLGKLLGGRLPDRPRTAAEVSAELEREAEENRRTLEREPVDALFVPVGNGELRCLQTDLPTVYLSDATFALLNALYPSQRHMAPELAALRRWNETAALAKADRAVFPSQWAADSAVRDYGAQPAKVRVIPFGANLDRVPDGASVVRSRPGRPCKLLFLGRDWERKGGDIAVETLIALRVMGIDAELIVVGGRPTGPMPAGVTLVESLNKNRPAERDQLHRLLREADFLLLPTRAECWGIVFCEACAFGLPIVATAVGGVPDAVRDGETGIVLPLSARGPDYAARIAAVCGNPDRYAALSAGARHDYDHRLNWSAWGQAMAAEFRALAAQRTAALTPLRGAPPRLPEPRG